MEQSLMRVKFTGTQNARTRAVLQRLREAGMQIDPVRVTDDGTLDIKRGELDMLLWMVHPKNASADIERLRAFRQMHLPIHVIAVASSEKAAACLDAGADDCVVSTIDVSELVARIRAHARRHGTASRIVRVYDLEIDSQTRTVIRAGKTIQLTPREFAVLEVLAAHAGKVVTRAMLWKRLYQETQRYASNVVDVYIRYLRQKIDNGLSRSLIVTVWGRGYMLRDDADTPAN